MLLYVWSKNELPMKGLAAGPAPDYPSEMCNRVIQKGHVVKPQGRLTVLMKGPGGEYELPFEAVFGGPARTENRNYWIKREGAEEVRIPDVQGFGEQDKTSGRQNWEDLPDGSSLEGLLLPPPPGKDYRLVKVVTRAATPDEFQRLGNDRAPVVHPASMPMPAWHRPDEGYLEFPPSGELVWTYDGAAVHRGRWTAPDLEMPLMEGKWENEAGGVIFVTHWAFLTDSSERPPSPPLPHPGYAHLQQRDE